MSTHDLQRWIDAHADDLTSTLIEAVKRESPSDNPDSLHAFADWLAGRCRAIPGAVVETLPDPAGPMVRAMLPGTGTPVLLLTHFDTVWPLGALPTRVEDGRLHGPGAFDMKGGLVQGLYAMQALAQTSTPADHPPVVLLATSDEEVASARSQARIEDEARRSQAVLVLEPAMGPTGVLKTWRKGVGLFTIAVEGRAAHAGGDHAAGRNAIAELARQTLALEALTDYARGTTVNVGVIQGGTRSNVVPEHAEIEVDFRATTLDEAERLVERVRSLRPQEEGFSIKVEGGLNRPPLEQKMAMGLFAVASKVASELGFAVEAGGTGGGSDGNFTAAIGIPTLDGLGAVGDGAHAQHEHVVLSFAPQRAALVAGLVQALR